MLNVTEPGAINDLVNDAAGQGREVTVRLIRDWTAAGLLDAPVKRSAGKGHGSRQALYPATQRELFALLLRHRPENGIKSLTRIPVGIWMYWGEQYVPLRQVRLALKTWLGDPRVSQREARQTAREMLGQLDHPDATQAARRELLNVLAELAYTGRPDFERLERAVRSVFEPGHGRLRRVVGHPIAPLMVDSVIDLTRARLTAITLLTDNAVTDDDFHDARHAHLVSFAEYAIQQPTLAASTLPGKSELYEPSNLEHAFNQCCTNLLTMLGVNRLHPERAAHVKTLPTPKITFNNGSVLS